MITTREPEPQAKRASPLAPEDRRIAIIEAIKPLLVEHGRNVTTRQIADAAGIAEGTVFRAFADKETLINAAVEHYLDHEPLMRELRGIDPTLSLEEKVSVLIHAMRHHFTEIFRMMAVIGLARMPERDRHTNFADTIAVILAPDLARLSLSPQRVAHVIRLVTFSTSFPRLNEGIEFSVDELTELILHGIIARPASDTAH